MDAHSLPSENYVRSCVGGLREENVDVVGMPWRREHTGAQTSTAQAIALAVAHPFVMGDAQYRLAQAGEPREVGTRPVRCIQEIALAETWWFSMKILLANEDYDFNYRVRLNGGRVLLEHNRAHGLLCAPDSV